MSRIPRPSDDEPGYGGSPASHWGPWIQHRGGDRPSFVRIDLDHNGHSDPADYRGIHGLRGVGRNFSPTWKDIRWFRLPAGHPIYKRIRLRYSREGWFRLDHLRSGRILLGPFPSAQAAAFLQGFAEIA